MRIAMGIAGTLLLSLGAMTAQATTYGLDLTIKSGAHSYEFDGTFDFTKTGTCTASSLLCDAGTIPDFTHVNVSDGFNGLTFTEAALASQRLTLIDLNGNSGLSSQILQLSFDLGAPLGGHSAHIPLSNIVFNVNSNGSGTFVCGTSQIRCNSSLKAVRVAAPELDAASTGGAVVLLLGSLAVLGGRRLQTRYR